MSCWKPILFTAAGVVILTQVAAPARADAIDDAVLSALSRRNIPGLSLAIIDQGRIVRAQGYGVTTRGGSEAVTAETLFQAASISKPVTALGALHLVAAGKLSLDADINTTLTSWRVPENEFTREQKVTLRRILSHSAAITVSGFGGYGDGEPVPTLQQILDGITPANSAPIRVDAVPGSIWRYSGGGYTVLQQAIIDASGQSFPSFMSDTVLVPLGMTASRFEQPLTAQRRQLAATGHDSTRQSIRGGAHVYPELAAAGLWTTPTELARFAIGIQSMLTSKSEQPVLSPELTRQMLTRQKNQSALGFAVYGDGSTQRFEHGGRNAGFDSYLTAYLEKGKGAVIMLNANTAIFDRTFREVLNAIAIQYDWPDYGRLGRFEPIFAFYEDFQKPVVVVVAVLGISIVVWCWRLFRRNRRKKTEILARETHE